MYQSDLPKCECGHTCGLIFYNRQYFCGPCLIKKMTDIRYGLWDAAIEFGQADIDCEIAKELPNTPENLETMSQCNNRHVEAYETLKDLCVKISKAEKKTK